MRLILASPNDAELIWKMQVEAFAGLLEKYQDYETNPGNETVERVRRRLNKQGTYFYLMEYEGEYVGAIRVFDSKDPAKHKRISPLFVMPQHRNRGFAQTAILEAERLHGEENWSLVTILQEKGNCHLYEKMAYHQAGIAQIVNNKMTLIIYEK